MWDTGCGLGRSTSGICVCVEAPLHLQGHGKVQHMGKVEKVEADINIILEKLTSIADK